MCLAQGHNTVTLAADSHKISSFTLFLKVATKFKTVIFGGAFRVKIFDQLLTKGGNSIMARKGKVSVHCP